MLLQPVGLRRATSGEPSSSTHPSHLSRAQLSAMTPPRSARGLPAHTAVLRVRPTARGSAASAARVSQPLRAAPDGIAIGTAAVAAFYCFNDPMVSPEHGTLECTAKHGVWVYVDHSAHGTTLNGTRRLLRDAAVVRSGDRLLVGATEIELHFDKPLLAAKEDEPLARHVAGGSSRLQPAGIAPSPIEWTGGKLEAFRSERPKALAATKSFASATPPQHTASPAPGFNPRRKRHSMTAFTPTPSPPPVLGTASSTQFLFQRTRPLVPSAPSTPPRADATRPCSAANISPHQSPGHARRRSNQVDGDDEDAGSGAVSASARATRPAQKSSAPPPPPPPLGYSSSPVAGPSQFPQRTAPQIPQSPSPRLAPQKQPPQQQQRMFAATDPPRSQRDDLRRRVLKKMELDHLQENKRDGRPIPSTLQIPQSLTPRAASSGGAASSSSPSAAIAASAAAAAAARRTPNQLLEFTPPSSPVAHKDILRQKESLLNILKHKYKEEQLLKQQQEEWMRHHFSLTTPPVSPIRSKARDDDSNGNRDDDGRRARNDESDEISGLEIPPRAPVLLRTISLGIHQASPRLTAAVLASRARLGSFDGKHPNQRSPTAAANASRDSADLVSVSSSVSTELACHRRVTRSLSFSSKEDEDEDFSVQSAAVHDFLSYEDDDGSDGLASFASHAFYSSDDCKSIPKDDAASSKRQLFSSFYSSPPSTLSSSSSLVLTGSATKDRFAIDIVTPREPEDDEMLESPKRSSAAAAAAALRHKPVTDATASPNLFDKTQRRPLYKPTRHSQAAAPSDDAVSAAGDVIVSSSPSTIRSSRRQPSPV